MKKIHTRVLTTSLVSLVMAGCAVAPGDYKVNPSRMEAPYEGGGADAQNSADNSVSGLEDNQGPNRLKPLAITQPTEITNRDLSQHFSGDDKQQLTANEVPMKEFIQLVFGETLDVNYVAAPEVYNKGGVTLNVKEPVSSKALFRLVSSILIERSVEINRRDGIFYIYPANKNNNQTVIGIGRDTRDVPDSVNPLLQIIPLKYGITTSVERTLRNLVDARIVPDYEQSALFVQGSRAQILQVIDLVNILDVPSHRGKNVGLLRLNYVTPEEFISKAEDLLGAEGIKAGTSGAGGETLLMIPIEQIGGVALFAGNLSLVERAEYWAKQIDRPSQGPDKRYFIYHPVYSRASDLGASIAPLIGGSMQSSGGNRSRDTQSAQGADSGGQSSGGRQVSTVSTDDIRMTVDERSNKVIFYTDGNNYQSLLPIIRQLDVLPKQILLDATIAEVTLADEFARGFEFAFTSGEFSTGTLGALGTENIAGLTMNWTNAVDEIVARMSESNSLVNVLSNPTLVVRDGVAANISVGNDIPTVGSTTTDPINSNRQTTNINYRKTGVRLEVTPTINAQGLVVLEINQEISNTSDTGPSLNGSPSIFERSIKTEVIAQSGQTILLGGLISENNSDSFSKVPGLGDIPVLGSLFSSRQMNKEKTELVIFITPRVIESTNQWASIRERIRAGLKNLKIVDYDEEE